MIYYFEEQLREINNSIQSMDMNIFEQMTDVAVTTLKEGHKVIVSGLGKNVPISDKFVGSMISMGLDACFLHTNSAIHGDMGIVKDGDMVILLSKSGETEESIYLVKLLKQRNISMWLLTFARDSTLTREISDHLVIDLQHEGDLWNIMPNNSTTINLIILQGLAISIAKKMDLNIDCFKRNHPGGNIGKILQ